MALCGNPTTWMSTSTSKGTYCCTSQTGLKRWYPCIAHGVGQNVATVSYCSSTCGHFLWTTEDRLEVTVLAPAVRVPLLLPLFCSCTASSSGKTWHARYNWPLLWYCDWETLGINSNSVTVQYISDVAMTPRSSIWEIGVSSPIIPVFTTTVLTTHNTYYPF